ncbi:MAG: glycoside hydrolase family 3 protein [Acidimicrobiales bacterium]
MAVTALALALGGSLLAGLPPDRGSAEARTNVAARHRVVRARGARSAVLDRSGTVSSTTLPAGKPSRTAAAVTRPGTVETPPRGTGRPSRLPAVTPGVASCPWLAQAMNMHEPPAALAGLVLARMTLTEKLGEIVLASGGGYENFNAGVPRLCIPSLTLQDGPQGLAFGDTGVTQLPSPLGVAATFDTAIARQYGAVEGAEARGQGIDVVQGPNLNIDRVPQSGRAYEGYGEDPLLASAMGVADIKGIQSQGVLADAKHLVAYSQETNRVDLNTSVSARTLHEIYLRPFEAAVRTAHVDSVMCAYPELNGTFQCQDPMLTRLLDSWGFAGFYRSDLGAAHDPAAALKAGIDLLKPETVAHLAADISTGSLPMAAVNSAVLRVITEMFATGLVGRPVTGSPGTPVDSAAHTAFALSAAERSFVLLRNRKGLLPLDAAHVGSIAVIGADAKSAPLTAGHGSSYVNPPFTSLPLTAIRQRAGAGVGVSYVNGGSTTKPLPDVPSSFLAPGAGAGHGLTLTIAQGTPGGRTLRTADPMAGAVVRVDPLSVGMGPGTGRHKLHGPLGSTLPNNRANENAPAVTSGTHLTLPASWANATATFTGTVTFPRTGLYSLALEGSGGATLTLDGVPAVSDPVSHIRSTWAQAVQITGGHAYKVVMTWKPFASLSAAGRVTLVPSSMQLGWQYDTGSINAAVAAARAAQVAVVFGGTYSSEGLDHPSLQLPGDQNALISAVAAANPRTVVVLNTDGPVLMPWLHAVSGVVEAWYPGEVDGTAIAALLFGGVDPSGRLPVTFPVSEAQSAIHTAAQWPGINLVSTYSEGLDVGYRYYNAKHIRPLFPFGFGLSYTSFSMRGLAVARTPSGYGVSVEVTNTGHRSGVDVPQVYLSFPKAAGEPPDQLAAFTTVTLAPGQTKTVTLAVPRSALACFLHGRWSTLPGTYVLSAGQSSADLPLHASVQVG